VGSSHLAIDLGAESGRAFIGRIGTTIELEELGRFRNAARQLPGRLAWDLELIQGFIEDAARRCDRVDSISIDGWGVDFGLLDGAGALVAPPRSYRDPFKAGSLDLLLQGISAAELYDRTGIQVMEINTSCQLAALSRKAPDELARAHRLLMVPDLLRLRLGAEPVGERTNASTTQLLTPSGEWDPALARAAGVPLAILPGVVNSYEVVGRTATELGGLRIVAGVSHDTAAAVAGAPLRLGEAVISSGTWSLVGLELPGPVISPAAFKLNLSNEHGVDGTTRLLRNVMGLWMVQEARRAWAAEDGFETSYADLSNMATGTRGESLVNPDDPGFLRPDDMPAAVQEYCRRTGQVVPTTRGEILRTILESLALRYRWVIEALETVSGTSVDALRVVGGGSQNELLCQLTADATGRPLTAGPVEATVLGNLLVQAVATGALPDLASGRAIVQTTHPGRLYQPSGDASPAFERFCALPTVGTPLP
jgi:rhamnulokinase